MSTLLHKVISQEIPRDYRTEIPNIVFELLHTGEISIQDFALYCLFRRIAGEKGACWIGQRGLMERLHCRHEAIVDSKRNLSRSFDQLNGKPLIEIHQGDYKKGKADTITIVDIWFENHYHFKEKSTCVPNGSPLCPKRITPVSQTDHKKEPIRNNQEEVVLCSVPEPWIKIEKVDSKGNKFLISQQDLTTKACLARKNWSLEDIKKCWECVIAYNHPLNDWFAYCEGVMKNIQAKNNIQNLREKGEKCKKTNPLKNNNESMTLSEISKKETLKKNTLELAFPNFNFQKEVRKMLENSL